MDPRKHYKILEIDRSASLEEARQAYRDLIAVWHPDRYTHNPRLQKKALEKVKAVNAAFEIVSRFIIEKGFGNESPPKVKSRPTQATVQEKNRAGDNSARTTVWEKTEARLAQLARAKELAQAREAARARETAKIAAAAEKRRAASKEGRLQAENRTRAHEKETAERARLEKKMAREKAWAETEQKLRTLKLAREKVMLARADNSARHQTNRVPWGRYVKQVLICGGILWMAFSGNAIQSLIHINFTAMLVIIGSGLLVWWVVARVAGSGRVKK